MPGNLLPTEMCDRSHQNRNMISGGTLPVLQFDTRDWENIPDEKYYIERNKRELKDFDYRFFDEKDLMVISKLDPWLKRIYHVMEHPVLKSVVARQYLLYKYGGWYFDTDDGFDNEIPMLINRKIPQGIGFATLEQFLTYL
eukprot:UN08344